MLKFFFNRFSKMVVLMEMLGVVFTAGWFYQLLQNPPGGFTKIFFGLYLFEYLFLRLCATVRWHKQARRYEGIELQFKKGMIPASYAMALTSGIGFFTGSALLLWPAVALIGVVAHVNVLLLYLHFKDKNQTPVNYFSGNKFLNALR
ncbi:MAG: hypothetical protein HY466_00725 [Deltaproteobacteria bacterium]|nr:hypothetical protein [Deltaproteobacteria bacterium]